MDSFATYTVHGDERERFLGHRYDSLQLDDVEEGGYHYLGISSGDKEFMYLDPAEAVILADNIRAEEKRVLKPSRGGKLVTEGHEVYGKREGIAGFLSGDYFEGKLQKDGEAEFADILEMWGSSYGKEDYVTFNEKLEAHSKDVYNNMSPGFWAALELSKGFKACHPVYTPIYLAQLGANLAARHYNQYGNDEKDEGRVPYRLFKKGVDKTRRKLGSMEKDGSLNAIHTGISTSLVFATPFPLNLLFAADAVYNGAKAEHKGKFIRKAGSYVRDLFDRDKDKEVAA